MDTANRLKRLNDAMIRLDAIIAEMRPFVNEHVNFDTGEIKPMDPDEVTKSLPGLAQRVLLAMEAMRTLVLDGLLR